MALINQIRASISPVEGVYYLEKPDVSFEEIYIKLRKTEGRLYNDDEVKNLPKINISHKYYNEWLIRRHSAMKLIKYLGKNPGNKTVFELGCGNGWLSNMIADSKNTEVIGMDINITELEQAARVFHDKTNLIFIYGNVLNIPSSVNFKFDYLILPSVIAYFAEPALLIDSLLNILNDSGEIHIIDSPFYTNKYDAKQRTINYYNELGFPEMSGQYHHHSLRDLEKYNYTTLYNSNTILNKIKRRFGKTLSPFPWVRIKKHLDRD